MSTRTSHSSEAALHYITFTSYQWLPLFTLCTAYDLVYKWFNFLQEKDNIKTTAYTLMPNPRHSVGTGMFIVYYSFLIGIMI